MFLLLIFLLFNLIYSTKEVTYEFGNLEVISDLLPEDCFRNKKDYKDVDDDGLPKCVPFSGTPGACALYYNRNNNDYSHTVSRPTCAKDGNFGPKQCKGDRVTGRCFCRDASGTRIFGQEWWDNAANMTCACSRKKADMQAARTGPYFNSLHCNSLGNYEPLQCDVVGGFCWCAEEMTGELTSPIVPDKAMVKLPCYKSITAGIQYLRRCESQKYAQNRILYELELHGTKDVAFGVLLCDDDGSYGAYKIADGSPYCTWRDNSIIGTWHYDKTDLTGLNCYCARDSKIYAEVGKSQDQKCDGGGNYLGLQASGINKYCVDGDGFRKTPSSASPTTEENCALYYSY